MDLRGKTITPDWIWDGSELRRNWSVQIDETGNIGGFAPQAASSVKLPRMLILPGFINAHSHAFQRGLRATAQRFDTGSGNFWSWRETMYRLAGELDVDSFYDVSKRAFQEMLQAGMTSVGEFHYLHHRTPDLNWQFDQAIISAARDSGIRMRLIQTYYATGAIGSPLAGAQERFSPISRDEFVAQCDRLAAKLDPALQSLAIACHSIRAASIEDIRYFHRYARDHGMPFHIHVEEVLKEISDCVDAYGSTPLMTLLRHDLIDESVTAIHCTHSEPESLREAAKRGMRICLCPLTEGNLSDGFPDVPTMQSAGTRLCIGTDSNIRLSMIEELRWLEFGQRLRREARGIVVDPRGSSAQELLRIGTRNGAGALSLNCGEIAAGRHADFVAIDLDHPLMRDCNDGALLDNLIFGCGNEPISQVWIGGKPVK